MKEKREREREASEGVHTHTCDHRISNVEKSIKIATIIMRTIKNTREV